MKPPSVIWVVHLMAAGWCCWLSVPSVQATPIRIVHAPNLPQYMFTTGPDRMTLAGILTDPDFRAVLHALEQRTGVENLSEPEVRPTRPSLPSLWPVNRVDKVTFFITNR